MAAKIYVLGFAFDREMETVVLVKKNRPDWQKGCLNGVGGKVEVNELPSEAMAREFSEETGVWTQPQDWTPFAQMYFKGDYLGGDALVFCYKMINPFALHTVRTTTDEVVKTYTLKHGTEALCRAFQTVKNLPLLLKAAMDPEITMIRMDLTPIIPEEKEHHPDQSI